MPVTAQVTAMGTGREEIGARSIAGGAALRASITALEPPEVTMSRSRQVAGTLITAIIGLGACAGESTGPVPDPAFEIVAGNENGALISVGEWTPGGAVYRDPDTHLALYVRFNDAICNAGATEFVTASYIDVIRIDQAWRTVEKADGVWLSVYEWNGGAVNCAYLRNNPPLATGRGKRMYTDNDFYPFDPYAPGPGMNAFRFSVHGEVTTSDDQVAVLLAFWNGQADRNGDIVKSDVKVQLSPDPRP
jgi:hypothetical protein